jgi:hypothetical protein
MKLLTIKLLIIVVIMFAATSAFASLSYEFNVDTTSVLGQTGYLELQFNPGIDPGVASAVISNFTSNATLAGTPVLTGDVTGALPSTITINNTSGWNDYFHQITFGNNVQFALNLNGSANNSFGLSFYGADGVTPLLTSDMTNGFATTIDVKQNGAVVTNNSGQVTAAATPIPPSVLLFGSGLLGLVGFRRKAND